MEEKQTFSATAIKLDANGQLPTRFPLFVTGDWKNSVKGDFKVSLDHLKQMKSNFDNGVGFPTEDASTGLAIDFAHEYADKSAAWIKGLELQIDPEDSTKGTLFANPVEWTDAGAKAVQSGEFKCVSPMGSFGEKDGKPSLWSNPTNLKEKIANVLEGAGLTNIPFLRGMAPIRADKLDEKDLQNANAMIVLVYDQQKK
jgi:Mu-like prophage I protein